MTEKTKEFKRIIPYIPFKTFKGFINRLHTTVPPPVIDISVLQHMSGSMRSQLMSALRFLHLIEANGLVTNKLKSLVKAYKTESWTTEFRNVLFDAYAEVVCDLDLDAGTGAQLDDAFRKNGNVDGQMLDKAVRFYLAALKEISTTYSPHFGARKSRRTTGSGRKSKKKSKSGTDELEDLDREPRAGANAARFRIAIPGKRDCLIVLPSNLDEQDVEMVKAVLDAYVRRSRKT